MKVPTCARMAALDSMSQKEYGIPAAILMENASRSGADFILRELWGGRLGEGPLLFVVGKGNNGGDALVISRHLWTAGKRDLRVLLLQADLGELPRMQMDILRRMGVPSSVFAEDPAGAGVLVREAKMIVDGLYGIGLRGRLEGAPAALIGLVNAASARVVSLDVPSGLGEGFKAGFPAVKADVTITFEFPKLCLYKPAGRLLAGRVAVVPVGFPPGLTEALIPDAELLGPEILDELLPRPAPGDYKNLRGHVAVFAGSRGTTGAASLASEAALRSGAGLVSLFVDEDTLPILAGRAASVMVKPLPAAPQSDMEPYTALLVGPGWGRGEERLGRLRRLFAAERPGVLDADGLYLLKKILEAETPSLSGWVLTPHPGEFAALTGASREDISSDPLPFMEDLGRRLGCELVLKGHVTIIRTSLGKILIHDGMNPALGTAGSGDVLAGIIAGLLGRGMAPDEAAACGVVLHGTIGNLARDAAGFFLAEDLLPYISREAWRNAAGR